MLKCTPIVRHSLTIGGAFFDIILRPNIGEVINHEFTELLSGFR